ncbi:hypothetical protein [Herbiconiux daphne]|uniref:Uncharacterized protein n=1 Tax=Herbiconiux daphne TaxID=2970914 RepID=A0ABT2H4Z3_9MICO|nr:hypothetical protein [Herbiconiux daphne]MCS5734991.1 hypothetical protein [Herbiconiux daphne]
MTVVLPESPGKELAKPLKGGVFVLFWLVALALWIIAPHMTDPRWGAFLIDSGIVFASVGFAAQSITWLRPFRNTLAFGFLALGLFALGDFLEITALVYFLRMFVPFVALLSPLYATVGKVKVWYS